MVLFGDDEDTSRSEKKERELHLSGFISPTEQSDAAGSSTDGVSCCIFIYGCVCSHFRRFDVER